MHLTCFEGRITTQLNFIPFLLIFLQLIFTNSYDGMGYSVDGVFGHMLKDLFH